MKQLLVEKYRPKTIDGYVFQDESTEKKVRKWIKDGQIPNVLLSGVQGSGKTTLSRILVNELNIQDSDVLTVNASMLKIDYIREVLEPWMKKASFSKFKIVQLEELDRPLAAVQQALRAIIEDYSDKVRFIATCNYAQKIIPALHSRFQSVEMGAINEDGILDLVVSIIENEGTQIENDDDLLSHVDAYAPDIRKIINSIDEHTDEDKILRPLSGSAASSDLDEWEAIWKDGNPSESLAELLQLTELIDQNNFEWFYEVMYQNSQSFPDEANAVILMSQYLDRATRVANQRLNLDAFLYHTFIMGDE